MVKPRKEPADSLQRELERAMIHGPDTRTIDALKDSIERTKAAERDFIQVHKNCIEARSRAEKAESSLSASSVAPVLGECEECGQTIVTPLRRFLPSKIESTDSDRHDAARWREYAKLRDAATMDDTVMFRITTKRHGKAWGIDYAFSQLDLDSVGEELSAKRVGMAAEDKYRELQAALKDAA